MRAHAANAAMSPDLTILAAMKKERIRRDINKKFEGALLYTSTRPRYGE